MGEAKRKRERITRYMSEAQQHGADVHVPSDTEQFDKQAAPAMTPEQIDMQNRMTEVSQRFTAYANFISARQEAGPLRLLMQAYIQSVFNEAAANAMNAIIMERLGITKEEFHAKLIKTLEDNLFDMQANMGIIITNREVVPMPRDNA